MNPIDAEIGRKRNRATDPLHHVAGRRIGQDEGADDGDQEGPVHHPPGAKFIGKMPAIGPKDRGRDRVGGADHAGGRDAHAVDTDEVVRQPQGKRDEAPKNEEVVKGESPDLNVLQRLEHRRQRLWPLSRQASLHVVRIVLRHREEDKRDQCQCRRPDQGDGLPAIRNHHHRRRQLGNRGSNVAGAKNSKRGSLLAFRKPFGDIGDTDRERAAGNADSQCREEEGWIVIGERQQRGHHGRRNHGEEEHHAATVLVRPDAKD